MNDKLTIEDYLRGVSPLISDEALRFVLIRRGLDEGQSISDLDERDLDLAEGTAYYWLSNLPVGGSTQKDADGDWSHSEGGWQVSNANIAEWKRKCRALFDKWGVDAPVASGIKLRNLC